MQLHNNEITANIPTRLDEIGSSKLQKANNNNTIFCSNEKSQLCTAEKITKSKIQLKTVGRIC
ncbi:hypothetical protein, partial [Flagellimonas marinaquae]